MKIYAIKAWFSSMFVGCQFVGFEEKLFFDEVTDMLSVFGEFLCDRHSIFKTE